MIKCLDKSNRRCISAHSSRVQSILTTESKLSEQEAGGHTPPIVMTGRGKQGGAWGRGFGEEGKGRERLCADFSFLYNPRSQAREWCHPQWVGLPTYPYNLSQAHLKTNPNQDNFS